MVKGAAANLIRVEMWNRHDNVQKLPFWGTSYSDSSESVVSAIAILIDLDSGHFTPVVEPDHRSPIIIDSQFTKFIDFIDNSAGHSGHHGHNVYRSQDTSNFEQYWQIYGIVTCEFQLKLVLKQRSFKSSRSKMHLDVSGLSEIHEWLSNQIMHVEANTAPA
ncbi:hypothetical protein EN45_018340 [Penicillium chrysogenum]|uniref:Uncharacterized protein n=1 Tax=Penicillium chrysogenum TaxID=5076 RepID=A0A167WIJ9_PENCH|nr:hypothetical protein EN45_018340 [Penicillium chrysogenum]